MDNPVSWLSIITYTNFDSNPNIHIFHSIDTYSIVNIP
jgi:hypothetical protein